MEPTVTDNHPILCLIQARMGSSRLPGKVLMDLGGRTVLERMWERVTAADIPARYGVIATLEPQDDAIERLCDQIGAPCFRGDTMDVLDRHYQAWRQWGGEAIVKIPSDCPLIDPQVIERVVRYYWENRPQYDYVSNLHPQSYPDGNDVEILSADALTAAWREAKRPFQREHTTPFLWDNPARFRIGNVTWETGKDLSLSHRLTLDYAEDLEVIRKVFEALSPNHPLFTVSQIAAWLDHHPDIQAINAQHVGYIWYKKHLGELKTLSEETAR